MNKDIKIADKKFNKGDVVRLKPECKEYYWYEENNYDWEVYDYAYIQMSERESGNVLHVLEKDYYNDDMRYEVTDFWGWIVLLRSIPGELYEITFNTFSESFIELHPDKEFSRDYKIKQVLSD